ncbi:Uncharacterized protein Fot_12521 [Forsythia ovata]|uniref:Uncharacterized protein n=1 Tax=Forsythia ovata TaxID=205694 RepID=A0ABD1WMS4_9LAMI
MGRTPYWVWVDLLRVGRRGRPPFVGRGRPPKNKAKTETTKKVAQEQLEKKIKETTNGPEPVEIQGKHSIPVEEQLEKKSKKQQMVPDAVESKKNTPPQFKNNSRRNQKNSKKSLSLLKSKKNTQLQLKA